MNVQMLIQVYTNLSELCLSTSFTVGSAVYGGVCEKCPGIKESRNDDDGSGWSKEEISSRSCTLEHPVSDLSRSIPV